MPTLEQVNGYKYADESGKGYTQDEINEVLELATNELYNLPEDFSDEAYVNNLSEDIRILQDMANGKLDEADSARAWDILNRNVQRKDLGLLQQRDDVSVAGANENEVKDAQREWQEKGTESKYFKKWFKKSAVKNLLGKPLKVYHGTPKENANIEEFKGTKHYFAKTKYYAQPFAEDFGQKTGYEGKVFEAYLSIQKPLDLTKYKNKNISEKDFIKLMKNNGVNLSQETLKKISELSKEKETPIFRYTRLLNDEDVNSLKAQGYDGIIQEEFNKDIKYQPQRDDRAFIVFDSNQIKSVDNRGTFDTENPNIYYQVSMSKQQQVINALSNIVNGAEEETVFNLRDDLEQYDGTNDITFVFGNSKKGFQHIAEKHGVKALKNIIDTVVNGEIKRYVKSKKTIILTKGDYEAVLSLDENGNKKTWLLTGWNTKVKDEKSSDVSGEVGTQSATTQIKPTFSRQDLGAELSNIIALFESNLNPNIKEHEEKIDIPVDNNGYSIKLVKAQRISANMEKVLKQGFYPEEQVRTTLAKNTKDGKRLLELFNKHKKYKTNFRVEYVFSNLADNEMFWDSKQGKMVPSNYAYFETKEKAQDWIKNQGDKIINPKIKEVEEWHHISGSGRNKLIDINELKRIGFKIDTSSANKEFQLKPDVLFQSAYHGTPHKFDEFSLDAIGTGEGAQAHGWGLYFAENKDISEGYRKTLTGDDFDNEQYYYDNELVKDRNKKAILATIEENGIAKVIQVREKNLEKLKYDKAEYQKKKAELEWIKTLDEKKIQKKTDKGQLYEVDIPESRVLLDEDKAFSEQPQKVQEIILKLAEEQYKNLSLIQFKNIIEFENINLEETFGTKYVNQAFDKFKQNTKDYLSTIVQNKNGRDIYQRFSKYFGSAREASLKLNEYGIKGITYDGRQDGRCYVVFDDKAVKVLNTFYQGVEPEQQNIFPGNRAAKKIHKVKGVYLPAEKFIELFQNADASTIVHECAHWYLDELTRIAKYNEEVAEDLEFVRYKQV